MAEVARLDAILSADVTGFQRGMAVATNSIVNFSKLSSAAAQLQPFSKATAGALAAANNFQKLSDVLAQLKLEQQGVTDASELAAYNNAIKTASTQLKEIGNAGEGSFGKIGKALSSSLGSIRQLAYILPGIGLAGIFNLAFEAITEVVSELHLFGEETSIAAKYSKDLNEELGKENAGLNTELVKLSALVQVARDHSATLQARKSAITELQKEYPGYLSNINLENINSQEAANAIGKLTDALARKAKVQAYSNLLTKASEDLIKAQNSDLGDNVSLLDKIVAVAKSPASGGAVDLASKAFKNQAQSVKELQGVVDSLSHTLADLTQQEAGADDFALLNPTKIKAAKAAIEELTPAIKKLSFAGQITFQEPPSVIGNLITKELDKSGGITVAPKITLNPVVEDAKALAQKLGEILGKTAEDAAYGVGEAIGNAISGKKNPFNVLFEIIGAGIKALGKELIVFSKIAEVVQKALENAVIAPQLALVAGVALVALGTVIANKGVQLHAEGGIFTQPTQWGNHIIGEKGPEALVPLNRMGELGIAGGGRQVVVMETRISGNDLILIQNRAQTAAGRAYGNNFNRRN